MTERSSLSSLVARLPLLADRDGDGLPDALTARLCYGPAAGVPETIAAMHLAARLAFETLALRESLALTEGEPLPRAATTIWLGRAHTVAANCPQPFCAALRALSAGEGMIAVSMPDRALFVGGFDAQGLAAAALAFCHAWDPAAADEGGPEVQVSTVTVPAPAGGPTSGASAPSALRSLAGLYGPEGLACDTDGDLLPDLLRARLALPDDLTAEEIGALIDIAARLGLESLGLVLPFAFPRGDMLLEPDTLLVEVSPLGSPTSHHELGGGAIRLCDWIAAECTLVVRGDDARGRLCALRELALLDQWTATVPTLEAMEQSLARLCALADPGATLYAAAAALLHVPAAAGESVEAIFPCPSGLTQHAGTLAAAVSEWASAQRPISPVTLHLNTAAVPPLFDIAERFTWEVEEIWQLLQERVLVPLAALPADDPQWLIDVRVSEPEGRRRSMKRELLALIRDAGRTAREDQVRVLPVYRQGQAWLMEEVLPLLLQVRPARVLVRAARFVPEYPSLELPTRWLQELFPIDELLAPQLSLPLEAIQLDVAEQDHTYMVQAFDQSGTMVICSEIDVPYEQRPYLQRFPAWGAVHGATGFVQLLRKGVPLVTARVASDPERVWDYIQGTVMPRIEDAIRTVCGGEPRREVQPFFGDLIFDVWLSEEDAMVGVREERNSTLESLHEDIYFTVLDFCAALMGERDGYLPPWIVPDQPPCGPRSWTAPGRVIPRIHRQDGAAARIRVQLLPYEGGQPSLRWRSGSNAGSIALGTATNVTLALHGLELSARAGEQEISRRLVVKLGGPPEQQERAAELLAAWGVLRGAMPALSGTIPDDMQLLIERDGGAPLPIAAVPIIVPRASTPEPGDDPLGTPVPWDHILGIAAVEQQLRALNASPYARVFEAGRSAQGRPSYAIELTLPRTEGLWSRAKLSAWKCTLLLNARHHANEPSSSNAVLEVARRLLVDPQWRRYLDRVNVVILPGENPDGMALYDELADEHPTWMHHAARYNAAGLEYASEYNNPVTRHTEARVLPTIWRRWAPDIVCDDHGFPAHQWHQLFAGQGNPWFRDYWIAQGLIFAYLPTIRSPRYPQQWDAMTTLRERMIRALAADPEVAIWNHAHADRYVAYHHRWAPDQFPAPYDREVLMFVTEYDPDSLKPGSGNLAGLPGRYPGVTTASITTEVADESAQGSYMALCARAHLLLDRVLLDYLYDANAPESIKRTATPRVDGGIVLSTRRPRPVVVLPSGTPPEPR